VAARLQGAGLDLSAFGSDPIAGMKAALDVTPVSGTNVVELAARGPRPELLAATVNGVIEVYREQLASSYRSSASESLAQVGEEIAKLDARVVEKRREVEGFRVRHDIVSLEREENQVRAGSRARYILNAANERTAAAEGSFARSPSRRRRQGGGALACPHTGERGCCVAVARELRELERTFTADYLTMDLRPRAWVGSPSRAAARPARGEQARACWRRRGISARAARGASSRRSLAGGRVSHSARFNEYKSLQEQLSQLETVHRDAVQRRAKLEAGERARTPSVQTLEAATSPREPWRPLYWRDAAMSVAGSLVLALLAMWLVELFNRQEPQPSLVIAQPVMPGLLRQGMPELAALPMARAPELGAPPPALLPQQPRLPRELTQDEVGALYQAAEADSRLTLLLLLNGLVRGSIALRRVMSTSTSAIRVGGEAGHEVGLNETLAALLAARVGPPEGPVLVTRRGSATTLADLGTQTLCAAHDAGIERAAEVTPECLRHTYVAFLVRQGIRFADLTNLVGPLPTEVLAAYSALSPTGDRIALDTVERVLPPLRGLQMS
jgi:hypothetical protein